MTEVTLKPCPFCGGEAKIISPLGWGNVRAVECGNSDNCAATGPWFSDEKHAIIAWNTRTGLTETPLYAFPTPPAGGSDEQE